MSTTTTEIEKSRGTLSGLWHDYVARLRGGEVGSLPALLGLIVLLIVFTSLRPHTFTTAFNFGNLVQQSAGVTIISMGLVFVLLLGEIDLGAGYTGGSSAAVMALLLTRDDWPVAPAIIVGLLTGVVIGFLVGLLVSRLGIPSFVVTLATFLALQGVMLTIIGERGSISTGNWINKLNSGQVAVWLGWVVTVVLLVFYAVSTLLTNRRRARNGLHYEPMLLWTLKVLSLTVIAVLVVYYLSIERSPNAHNSSIKGIPISLLILVGLAIVLTALLSKTRWGSHVYAVGGNAEAARRAGINVSLIRITCFMVSSAVAAIGGIMLASYTNGVNNVTGGSTTLLYAVGAAVIGGTSLFGGRGRVVDALIGGTVVAVIANGMGLLNQPDRTKYIVTGFVLLAAALIDALSRRRAASSGR